MDRETTKTWQEYEEGLAYQRETGLSRKLPEYERFKQGDQWPAPSKRTANLPRPVFNIVNFFIRTKRANVLNQTIKMIYSPTEQGDRHAVQGAQDFTDFAAVLWNELDQDELNENFVDDCATGGTGILHFTAALFICLAEDTRRTQALIQPLRRLFIRSMRRRR